MSYKAIYTYAWDLAETGVAAAIDEFRGLGLDTVTIAGSYHAGKFMRPHGKAGKVYFPEDGTVYFNADAVALRRHQAGRQRPARGRRHPPRADRQRHAWRSTSGWCCCTTRGSAWRIPDAVVRNAFGDPYYYNLCPSAPDARAYAIGLARDVTESYPVAGISLEAPGFTPYAHGFHHEFALMKLEPLAREPARPLLLRPLRRRAPKRPASMREGSRPRSRPISPPISRATSTIPPDMAEAFWRADIAADGDLRRYLDFRNDVVTSLVARNPRRGPRRRQRRGHPLGRAADRRRLVRGQRPPRARPKPPASSRPASMSRARCG